MLKPLLNQEQRLYIKHNTHYGAKLKLTLACLHFNREIQKVIDCIYKKINIYIGV